MNFIYVKSTKNGRHVRSQLASLLQERRLAHIVSPGKSFPQKNLKYGTIDLTTGSKVFRMWGDDHTSMKKYLQNEKITEVIVFSWNSYPNLVSVSRESLEYNYIVLGLATDFGENPARGIVTNLGAEIKKYEGKPELEKLQVLLYDFLLLEDFKAINMFSRGKTSFCIIKSDKKTKKVVKVYFGSNSDDMFWEDKNKYFIVARTPDIKATDAGFEQHVLYTQPNDNHPKLSSITLPYIFATLKTKRGNLNIFDKHTDSQDTLTRWKESRPLVEGPGITASSEVTHFHDRLRHNRRSLGFHSSHDSLSDRWPDAALPYAHGRATPAIRYVHREPEDKREVLTFQLKPLYKQEESGAIVPEEVETVAQQAENFPR